ncbi:carboxypeptidase-like regulatory domain-containing protein [Phocaeicola vulgatus]|uniref:carboxypeptidase-like regulatory domain-containing protein n=1 Tax=Phocaeicola vulgatus TaxID=821 RepID=UPI00293D565D|nr:carboxypeptidase-like regulatory domain-containing protein [Phocaeicola vulgatus]
MKGRVLSAEDKEPLIGATVKIPGTSIGVVTDIDGNFSLEVPDKDKTLVIEFLGMSTLTIIRKSKFPQNPKRSVRFSGKRTKRSVQKRKARNTQKAETKVL